jgi:Ca2+/H+ antiporter, TMEM165/GDT1 family
MSSPQFLTAALTSGAASLVEFIEALTVVLALGATRSWRSALCGAAAAVVVLAAVLGLFGGAIGRLPIRPAQFVLGVLLMLFGTRWLRKATRRAAGVLPRRNEMAALRRHEERFATLPRSGGGWDSSALAIAFQATAFEGMEVVFIVVAIGAAGGASLRAAAFGAAVAFAAVCALGLLLHRPITRVPENALKRLVGAALAGLGTFWIGAGAGLSWPGDDLAILPLCAGFLLLSALGAAWLSRMPRPVGA